MLIKDIRRKNLRALAHSVGGIQALANKLNRAQSQISHLIGKSPIKQVGDKTAVLVEEVFNKPAGWLDQTHHFDSLAPLTAHNYLPVVPLVKLPQWKELTSTHFSELPMKSGNKIFSVYVNAEEVIRFAGIYVPLGVVFIMDILDIIESNALVILHLRNSHNFFLGQYVLASKKHYLRPFNCHESIIEITDKHDIYGIIRRIVINYTA